MINKYTLQCIPPWKGIFFLTRTHGFRSPWRIFSHWFRVMRLKGKCPRFFTSDFFHESVSPKPLSIPIGPFRNLLRYLQMEKSSQSQKIENFVWTPVSLTPVANLPPVWLILVVYLDLRISPRIFQIIQNYPKVIFRGLGEDESCKKPVAKIS